MAVSVATAAPATHASAQGAVTVRLCTLRRGDGSLQLACARRDLVLLSGTFTSEQELLRTVNAMGVPERLALASMFAGEVELTREQLHALGFGVM